MRALVTHAFRPRLLLLVLAAIVAGAVAAQAAVVTYSASLSGAAESPPNPSPGIGSALVEVDATAHTLHLNVAFSGLIGTTSASHIHAPTLVAGTGTAGVATTTPYFAGFPIGVTAGLFDIVLNTLSTTSYNSSYITANGGTAASAEAALFQAIADGKAYLNIHTSSYTGGEIRGFILPGGATPARPTTWARIKSLYR